RRRQLIAEWARIPRAAAVPAAVDDNDPVSCCDQGRHLMSPVAAVAETAVQQNDRASSTEARIPDGCAIMIDIALLGCGRQRWCAVGFEQLQTVVGHRDRLQVKAAI